MKRAFLFTVIATLSILTGCGHRSLKGSWAGEAKSSGAVAPVTVTFKDGGQVRLDGEVDLGGNGIKFTLNGAYEETNDKVVLTLQQVDVQGGDFAKAMVGAALEKGKNKPQNLALAWKSDDEIDLSLPKGQPSNFPINEITLKRQKA